MYERNAVVLERYFDQMFGYNMKRNIKTNFEDYCELIDCLEKYQNVSEEEEAVIQEYDSIANRIREVQKLQENLNKRNSKLQEERETILKNIEDNAGSIQKKLDAVNSNINKLNEEITENAQKFVDVVAEFNEKSVVRTECEKTRRSVEGEYNRKLNETLDNYQDIDLEIEKRAKQFIELETDDIEQELKEKMKKNGEKEKTPFNVDVLSKAIALAIDIQKRETDILANAYDKTNRLFTEIKAGNIRISKHKKIIKDAKCKLEFIAAIKDYLIQFLDNERLTAVNGEEEHSKLMQEACKNLDEDLVQINNLYTLLLKEAAKKIGKKSYSELFNFDYLITLENKSEEFDIKIKKLNLSVTVINPNHWRIEGMQKIYDVFCRCVTESYDRDLTDYLPKEEEDEEESLEENFENFEGDFESQNGEEHEENVDKEHDDEVLDEEDEEKKKENETKSEIDRKIDLILGFDVLRTKDDDDWDDDDDANSSEEDSEEAEDDDDDNLIFDDDDTDEDEEDILTDDDEESTVKDEENDEDGILEDEKQEEESNLQKKPKTRKRAKKNKEDVSLDIWGNDISQDNTTVNEEQDEDSSDESDIWDNEEAEDDDDDNFIFDEDEDDEDEDDTDEEEILDEDEEDEEDEEVIKPKRTSQSKNKNNASKDGKHTKQKKSNATISIDVKEDDEDDDDLNERKEESWQDKLERIEQKHKTQKKKGFFEKFRR